MITIDLKTIEIMPLGDISSGSGGEGAVINNQSKTVEITENGTQTITYDNGYTGLESVNLTVDVPIPTFTTQTKSVDITENGTQTVTVDEGYDGIESIEITTNVASSEGGDGNIFAPIGYSGTPQYIEDGIEYAKTIYDNWDASIEKRQSEFYNDENLLFCPLIDTSNATDMTLMFNECDNLQYVSYLNTSNATSFNSMFQLCTNLKYLDFSNWNTSNVTNMGYMFNGCNKLASLDLSSFNTSNVTIMRQMFCGCNNLTSLDVSSFNTSNVTDMTQMFYNCSGLTSLDLSSFNTSAVTNMSGMFNGCSGLTSLDLSSFNTSNVTDMTQMFCGCYKLASLDVSSFNTSAVTNMSGMFSYNRGLTSLDLSNFNTSAVTNMNGMFSLCDSLINVDGYISLISVSGTVNQYYFFGYSRNLVKLIKITFKDIGYNSGNTSYDYIKVPNWGVNSDEITDARQSLIDSLITYSYDRATAGYSTCTITLAANSKALLTEDEIAQITAKGFTIA